MLNILTAEFVSGFGQKHTNEPGAAFPRPYSAITLDGIRQLVDGPQQVDKAKAQWFIPSTLPRRKAKQQEANGQFWMLWADVDHNPPPLPVLANLVRIIIGDVACEIYTSRSAKADYQKARILIPLSEPLDGATWRHVQAILNDELVLSGITPDAANEGAGQLCYLPNRGEYYDTASNRTDTLFQPLRVWEAAIAEKRQKAERQAAEQEARRQAAAARREALTAEDTANSIIHAFNNVYDVEDILLAAGYDQDGGRFRHPESESGSFSASVLNGRVHSLSAADPLYTGQGGGAHDAFSAFTVLFAGGDQGEAARLAGDQWLVIEGGSWNAVKRREYARQKAQGGALTGFDVLPDGDPGRGRFSLLTPQEMTNLPPVRWRVKGVLPESGIGALYGPPASGKSFLVLDMLAAVASGRTWFDYRTNAARVVYIGLEGEAGIAQRVQAWQTVHGDLPANFRAILTMLDIRKDSDRAALVGSIQDAGMAGGVVVIDTLNQSAPGMDENDSAAMGLAIAAVKAVQRDLGGLVLLIHHSGKDATKGLRGHSSLLAALDASIEVSREGDNRQWRVGKSKDGVDGAGHTFMLETVTLGVDDDLDEISSCVVIPACAPFAANSKPKKPTGSTQKLIMDALHDLFQEIAGLDSWEAAERPRIAYESAISQLRGKIRVEEKRHNERAKSAIFALVEKGLIEHTDGYLLPC